MSTITWMLLIMLVTSDGGKVISVDGFETEKHCIHSRNEFIEKTNNIEGTVFADCFKNKGQ